MIIPTLWGSQRMTEDVIGQVLSTGTDTHGVIIPAGLACLTLGPTLSWGTPSWVCAASSKRMGCAALP